MPSGVYKHKKGLQNAKGSKHPHTKAEKEKISQSLIGNKRCIGRIPWNKGIGLGRKMQRKITSEQKQEIEAGRKKPGQCELCGRTGKICFDHDHKTGKFRGWICHKCNVSLGLIDDNIQTLELMIEYIKNNQSYE